MMLITKYGALPVFLSILLTAAGAVADESRDVTGLGDQRAAWEGDVPDAESLFAPPPRIRCPVPTVECRLPGEFEPQRALLIPCNELIDNVPEVFVNVVRQTQGRVEIISLVANIEQCEAAKELLAANAVPFPHVRFVEIPHDTMWARDYGPIVVKTKQGHPLVIDADYDISRANDDCMPGELARLLNVPVVQTPLRLDGGNLLSNGDGLAITTSRLFDENAFGEMDEDSMHQALRASYGLNQVVVLEPLEDEPTGHVDMFATFTAANVVVVGQYDPQDDPVNAAILDRNAAMLATLKTTKGPLQVWRIPMPSHESGVWPTYTNVIYANGVLLMPTYGELDGPERMQATFVYSRLLPQWKIVGVDASRLIESEGALHCVTMNLGPLDRLPEFPQPRLRAADTEELIVDEPNSLWEDAESLFARHRGENALDDELDDAAYWRPTPPPPPAEEDDGPVVDRGAASRIPELPWRTTAPTTPHSPQHYRPIGSLAAPQDFRTRPFQRLPDRRPQGLRK